MTVLLIILGSLLIFVLLIVALGSFFFYDYAIRRKAKKTVDEFPPDSFWGQVSKKMNSGKSWINSQNLERVNIKSFDQLNLAGHILPVNSNKVVVMMHGFRSQDFSDFSNSVKYFHEAGYNVLLCDQRAHGESEGKHITYGVKERLDCLGWTKFAVSRFGANCQIVLMGVSMGSATVLMTLGLEALPKNVKACVADCGYSNIRKEFTYVINKNYHLPSFPFLNICSFLCKTIAGFDMDSASPVESLKKSSTPTLFIHGEKDTFVPLSMTVENYEACNAPKELCIIENAEHAVSFLRDTEKCWKAINVFLNRYVK